MKDVRDFSQILVTYDNEADEPRALGEIKCDKRECFGAVTTQSQHDLWMAPLTSEFLSYST